MARWMKFSWCVHIHIITETWGHYKINLVVYCIGLRLYFGYRNIKGLNVVVDVEIEVH